ncbi:MAG: hypothetical protein JWN30_1678 [Bacilli bacterium]|nr:hypothetical protein [Bacilli bacterium]
MIYLEQLISTGGDLPVSDAKEDPIVYQVPVHMQGLIKSFAEMMTGESTPERIEILLQWALYMHIRSVMPPLAAHWNQSHPEESATVKEAIQKLQSLNEQWKASRKKP